MAVSPVTPSERMPARLDRLEAEYRDLKAILDDPLRLLDRLLELELQRRGAEREAAR